VEVSNPEEASFVKVETAGKHILAVASRLVQLPLATPMFGADAKVGEQFPEHATLAVLNCP
jgi:hypothetical protein